AIGTGAWKVAEFEPGIVGIFEAHTSYHRNGRPYVSEIDTFGIPDGSTRVNALLADEVDIITALEPQLVETVANSDSAQVLNQPGGAHPTYPMRSDTAPYTDNNVRLALKHAVDRERMLNLVWQGLGTVGRDHPIPQHDPFFAPDVEALPRDPDKVAYYLKKAGAENTVFEIFGSDSNFGGVDATIVMAETMSEAGANVQVKRVPSDGYWSAVWLKEPWCGSSWYGRPTADLMLAIAYISGGAWNESYWSNERFDSLVLEARQSVDEDLRRELYREIQIIMRDEGSTVTPVFTNWLDAYSNKVKDLKGHPHGFAGWMYWEDVWIDDSTA
ncbi:MAG: ABC transporter substrate-binding protein, partial [Rhodospirillaceae bacterium]|nr:ABC transporter substrate-binding protein [Rhodospirillaceae bacterium]